MNNVHLKTYREGYVCTAGAGCRDIIHVQSLYDVAGTLTKYKERGGNRRQKRWSKQNVYNIKFQLRSINSQTDFSFKGRILLPKPR